MRRLAAAMLYLCSSVCLAWELQPPMSSISFAVPRADGTSEMHRFTQVQGAVDGGGTVLLTIPLASIDTGIAERDQNIRNLLFEVAKFPNANFLAMVDLGTFTEIGVGEQKTIRVAGRLTLHGKTANIQGNTQVTRLADGKLEIKSAEPMIVDLAELDLGKSLNRLLRGRDVSMQPAVPIQFTLVFAP